ncbi:protein mono-ADP-ribosyltransferase PARP12 [Plectropomus leopardus]|uniref:protein mono-ADP-ribosyltransferase PARP12 n=1 Tax=Plectropomus leopardus TaxID=160734 RepID=UPI001C4BCDBB|nr:protein mono-ADP-ribosyltransferase PARP12 [Plectropomus leopardus]
MTSVISKFVTSTLCDHQGCLDFKRLEETLAQHFTVEESLLRRVLLDHDKIAIQEGRQKVVGKVISPDSLVVAKTGLRICQKKPGECLQCDGLHLCRFYVCGNCTFGHKCKNPHSLTSPYNAEHLKRYGLHDLTEKQLFQLLLQNDPYLLPEICPHYNKGTGVHGSCKFTTSCHKLHVCQHYLQGDCKFGFSCKRTHNVDAQGTKILQGFSQDNIRNLLEIYRNKFIITGQKERRAPAVPVLPEVSGPTQKPLPGSPAGSACPSKPVSDAEKNEICLFFIRRHCSFKDKCARVHWHLPYRWQVLGSDGVTWKDLPNMEDIEKAYCDPEHDTSCTDLPSSYLGIFKYLALQSSASPAVQSVDFMTMTQGGSQVRRLSTSSSILKPPHFILTTQWLWYWKDESGKWLEFGQGDSDTASVTSQTLENVYLADRETEIPFSAGKQQYVLYFKGAAGTQQMYQQNVKYKTKREVRRRPRFVSAQDVEVKLKSATSHSSSSSTAESCPSHWDKNALPDFGYRMVLLSKSAKEYNMIEKLFKNTMPQSTINSIKRIQNLSLWKVFQWQKEQMKVRNGGNSVNEQYLFHGTDESLIEAICEQNFDWRMCGVHGTAYGKGSYFARDASYSDRYAKIKGSLSKIMFVALVLVGDYTRGSSAYVRPPPKSNSKTLYDSCVDCESNPSIYVIFEKQQIYPEYVINYS